MENIQLRNIKLAYLMTGQENSDTILFVHGLGANLTQFKEQHKYFSDRYRVLSVDLRGHGQSSTTQKNSQSDFTLIEMGNDIIALLDALKIEKVHYIGNSMGGNIGYEIIKTHPEKLKSFVTYGTTAQLRTSSIVLHMMEFAYKFMNSKLVGNLSKSAGQTKASGEKIKEIMSQSKKSTILKIIPHLANFDYIGVIKSSNIPTLIIKGEMDKEINKTIKGTILAFKKKDNFTLYEMNGVGHFANLDNPDLFNTVVEDFIRNITRKPQPN